MSPSPSCSLISLSLWCSWNWKLVLLDLSLWVWVQRVHFCSFIWIMCKLPTLGIWGAVEGGLVQHHLASYNSIRSYYLLLRDQFLNGWHVLFFTTKPLIGQSWRHNCCAFLYLEPQTKICFERKGLKPTYVHVYIEFSLKVVARTCDSESGVKVSLVVFLLLFLECTAIWVVCICQILLNSSFSTLSLADLILTYFF